MTVGAEAAKSSGRRRRSGFGSPGAPCPWKPHGGTSVRAVCSSAMATWACMAARPPLGRARLSAGPHPEGDHTCEAAERSGGVERELPARVGHSLEDHALARFARVRRSPPRRSRLALLGLAGAGPCGGRDFFLDALCNLSVDLIGRRAGRQDEWGRAGTVEHRKGRSDFEGRSTRATLVPMWAAPAGGLEVVPARKTATGGGWWSGSTRTSCP